MSLRLPRSVGVLSAMLLAAGCQTQHPVKPSAPPSTISAAARRDLVAAAGSDAATPDAATRDRNPGAVPEALSQKTAAFARSMDAASSPAASTTPFSPSSVRWEQPPSPAPAFTTPPVAAANAPLVAITAPSPHHKGLVPAKPADGDEPAILPESSDFTDAASTRPIAPAAPAGTLEADIDRRVRESPQDTAAQLDFQLLQMLQGGSGAELAALSSASTEDKEIIAALTDGLTNFRTSVRQDGNMLLSAKIKPLLDMSDRLRSLAELSVDTAQLCRRVDGFGRYDPMDSRFRAGRENPTIVYCEIANFATRQDASSMWESKFSQQVSLYTDTGMLVWKDKVRDVPDTCRERRHDFFMYDYVHLPANLTIGRYILKITIVDELANHVAEKTLPVDIVADPSDAAMTSTTPVNN